MNATESETSSSIVRCACDEGELVSLFEQYKIEQCTNSRSSSLGAHHERRGAESIVTAAALALSPMEELELAAAFVTEEQQNVENRAFLLLQDVMSFSQAPAVQLEQFTEQAHEIGRCCIQISRFASQRTDAYFCGLGVDPRKSSLMLPSTTPWTYIAGGTRIVTLLSDIYEAIRSIEKNHVANKNGWEVPSSFERYTRKYWLDEGFLADVLVHCVGEIPLLVHGNSGLITNLSETGPTVGMSDTNDVWQCVATTVTSIYFDSPEMYLYCRRVARVDGASLVRVRWYGEKPQGDQLLFLEIKTHHESWTIDKSIKQRVSLRERDMAKLLARDGATWDESIAEELIRLATPTLEGEDLRNAAELLYQIRTLILKKDLRPCVRTHYRRLAFQFTNNNARRLTIDRDITLSDESNVALGQWCLPEFCGKTIDIVKVSNAVLEVKLAEGDDPSFVNDLLQSGAIQDAYKFSKYLTGAIKLHSDKVKTMPYWAALPMFDDLFGRNGTEPNDSSHDDVTSSKRTSRKMSQSFRRRRSSLLRRSSLSILPSTQQDLGQLKRVKVEPKTYFANERTYIQWVSVSLLLVTIATLLLGIAVDEGLNAPRIMSLVLIFAALFIAAYAFAVYFRRLHLLTNGRAYGYIDHVGPIILTGAVLMGIVGMMYYGFTMDSNTSRPNAYNPYVVATADSSGECTRRNFTGISLLEYQPSDVVVDETQEMLIIPSQSKLTGLPLDNTAGEAQISILGEAPGTDIEAITYAANGMLFAVSESNGSSTLLSFEPRLVGTRTFLDFVGQWRLEGRSLTEAMAYVPDEENGGKLYISEGAETTSEDSHVYVYDIPTINDSGTIDESIYPVSQLNGKVLTSGIPEAPKMGSMSFFEDVLYILHDNARVVRGWDLKSGAMVSEWILPRVEGGFDQQWEGMTLQRVSSIGTNMAEGEPDPNSASTVVLHLTLDSPPQVWSFHLKKEAGEGYTLPHCAAAY